MGFNVIGIVGPIACGKGVVTEYLIKEFGYVSFSLSSLVHEEAKKRGITIFTRTTLQNIGDEMRRVEGDGILAEKAMHEIQAPNSNSNAKIIIEGIRNPGEVEYLRTIPGFYLIAVDSEQEIRYQRVLKRGKIWDPKDWDSFLKVDRRDERDGENVNGQQVMKCMGMADITLENNDDIGKLNQQIEAIFRAKMSHSLR